MNSTDKLAESASILLAKSARPMGIPVIKAPVLIFGFNSLKVFNS